MQRAGPNFSGGRLIPKLVKVTCWQPQTTWQFNGTDYFRTTIFRSSPALVEEKKRLVARLRPSEPWALLSYHTATAVNTCRHANSDTVIDDRRVQQFQAPRQFLAW